MVVAIVRFVLGFIAATLVAGLVQVLFVAGIGGVVSADSTRLQNLGLLVLLAATQSALFAAPFALITAVVAAWLPIRAAAFFIAAGAAIALAGFLAQWAGEGRDATILNLYAVTAYVASGLAGGLVYWAAGVPKKGGSRPAISA